MGTYNISYQYPTAIRKLLELQLKAKFHKNKVLLVSIITSLFKGTWGGRAPPSPPIFYPRDLLIFIHAAQIAELLLMPMVACAIQSGLVYLSNLYEP